MAQSNIFNLCIVGAGLVGSAAARHASQSGLKIALIGPLEPSVKEKQNRDVFSCHYDEGRITRIFDPLKESQVLNKESIHRYREIEDLSGISFYNPVGTLFYGKQGSSIANSARDDQFGYSTLIDITSNFKSRFPFMELRSDEVAYFEENPAGNISPRKLVAAQQIIAQKQGCHFIPEIVESVTEADGDAVKYKITTQSGKSFSAHKVLLCTNTFTNFKKLLPQGKKAKLVHEKSLCSLMKITPQEANRLKTMPSIIYSRMSENNEPGDMHVYGLPPVLYPDGQWYLKMGWELSDEKQSTLHTLDEIKQWYLGEGDPARLEKLTNQMRKLLPGVQIESVKPLTCSTCHSPTKLPYIDMVTPNLGLAIAGNGTLAKCADEVGRIAAKLVMEGVWSSELDKNSFSVQWE